MSATQVLGRLLFIAFLLIRGIQHVQKPEDWGTKFAAKYHEYFDVTSKLPFVSQNVPAKWLGLLHPQYISVYATTYGKYIGFTELALAALILVQIPLLPIIGATFLLLETLIFFNPFNPKLGNEIYYLIVNVAIVGIIYMMAFAPPIIRLPTKKPEGAPKTAPTPAQSGARVAGTGANKRTGSAKRE